MVTFNSVVDTSEGVPSPGADDAILFEGALVYRYDPNTDMVQYAVGFVVQCSGGDDTFEGRFRVLAGANNISAGANDYTDVSEAMVDGNFYLVLLPLDAPISNPRTTPYVRNLGSGYNVLDDDWFGDAAAWATDDYRGCQRQVSRTAFNGTSFIIQEDTAQR